ncbi:MAG: M20 family metallopeptidase [Alphaproteobacteria bacterium]|nr:M20 family metallopeptidase [Alphaproteobacteria bacterium]
MSLVTEIARHLPEYTAWRRDFHAHPQTAFEETRTAGLVAERLEAMGIEVHRGIGGTGLVGVIRGARGGNSPRTVGLRADMDALPMQEANGFSHASTNPGRMHACGHDGHTTMLLAAARHLAEHSDFEGSVHLFFQPAEEVGGGGPAMLKDGALARFPCDAIYALHNKPGLPVGHFALRAGPMLAGVTFWDIHVQGKGGHAARPEVTHDPVVAGAALVSALQSVVARNVSPHARAVLSVTGMETGRAYNVIPDQVRLFGTVRTFDVAVTELVRERMERLAESVASGFGCRAALDFRVLTPPLVNSAEHAVRFGDAVAELAGEAALDRVQEASMGGEDFAYFLQEVPGAFLNVGNAGGADLHHPKYDFNDEAIPHGAAALVAVALRELAGG